ncbi:MAG: hypothetical protein H0T78_05500 [Longispora sp.]|nr:hypothetical protein [Longispora sp. (in: high G+C Gram-positive bacteria)]
MTGITAGDSADQLVPPFQRIRPESIPESPEVLIRPESIPESPEVLSSSWPTHNSVAPRARIKPPKDMRRPAVGLALMTVFSLLAVFFSWVSADPFWLAVGHGDTGTLTITQCTTGMTDTCEGKFSGSGIDTTDVTATGITGSGKKAGDQLTAQMVSGSSRTAYAGDSAGLHLRWLTGFALVVLCGFGVVWGTGAMRLERKNRLESVALSFGIPVMLLFGVLIFTW